MSDRIHRVATTVCNLPIPFALLVSILHVPSIDADERPNILIVFADDWGRYASLHCAPRPQRKCLHVRIWFKVASHWPGSKLLTRAVKAAESYVRDLLDMWRSQDLFAPPDVYDPRDRSHIVFAPLPLK